MTASQVKALLIGLLVVAGVAIGVGLWRENYGPTPEIARLASPAPTATKPSASAPSTTLPDAPTTPKETSKLEERPSAPDAHKPEPSAGNGEPPHFDVVRIAPTGEAVIAGKGDPHAKIGLLASGKVIGETTADASGHFVILPSTLPSGSFDLTLRQTSPGKPSVDSTQSVAVALPKEPGGQIVVALAEPGQPTKLLSGAPEAPPSPPAAGPASAKPKSAGGSPATAAAAGQALAIRSVELENGNGFFASGAAAPGTHVQIYLNGTHLADIVAGADGLWSVTLKKGLTGGHYIVRADASGADGAVTARAEVPFDVPVAMAQLQKPDANSPKSPTAGPESPAGANPSQVAGPGTGLTSDSPTPGLESQPSGAKSAGPEPSAANAIVEQIDTALVIPGDNLWNISRARLGHGKRFTQIYAANVGQIRDPRLIYPGQVFVVPPK